MTPNEKSAMHRKVLLACSQELEGLSLCLKEIGEGKVAQFTEEDAEAWFDLVKHANVRKFVHEFFTCDCGSDNCAICNFYDDTLPIKTDV